jgi:hypothetical protein
MATVVSMRKKHFWQDDETFVAGDSSIPVQLVTGRFLARFEKNPAVAAAGS